MIWSILIYLSDLSKRLDCTKRQACTSVLPKQKQYRYKTEQYRIYNRTHEYRIQTETINTKHNNKITYIKSRQLQNKANIAERKFWELRVKVEAGTVFHTEILIESLRISTSLIGSWRQNISPKECMAAAVGKIGILFRMSAGIEAGILFRILESYFESWNLVFRIFESCFRIFESNLKYKVIPNHVEENSRNSLCRTPRLLLTDWCYLFSVTRNKFRMLEWLNPPCFSCKGVDASSSFKWTLKAESKQVTVRSTKLGQGDPPGRADRHVVTKSRW